MWLADRPQSWRDRIEVVAMDGFTGFKTAAAEELPDAVTVMDPFHVVRLAGDALDRCRRRVQQDTCGHRGRKGDPLYAARRTLHTGADLLTDKQTQRLQALFTGDEHVEVEATWGIYQRMIAAYRQPDRARARELMQALVESVSAGVPAALTELVTLGRTLKKRAADVLAYFDRPGTSNGPTEAIIIWSPPGAVSDVAHGADRVRQRHVIWSLYTTETPANHPVIAAFALIQALFWLRRGHVSDADPQVRGISGHRAPDNHQRPPRTPPRLGPRLPQPDQLHRQITAGNRRIQTPTTPSTVKSRIRHG
jgi:hypothetical protein